MATFDWVKARADCSAARSFKQLEVAIRANVDSIIEVKREAGDTTKFTIELNGKRLAVLRERLQGVTSVDFNLDKARIVATTETGESISAAPTLNRNGECRLVVGNAELEMWQFCRMALDGLFFND